MKRQKFKVFNSCCHNGKMNNNENRNAGGKGTNENKLFTILLNRSAIFGVALLFSTLLPLNQAAPTLKPFVQTEIVSNESTLGQSQTKLPSTTTLKGIQINKVDDKMILSTLQSPIKPFEKSLSLNNQESSIHKNNQNVETIKFESAKETMATISSTIEHNDQNNNNISHFTISQTMITALPELLSPITVSNNAVERKIYADKSKQYIINSPPATDLNDDENEKLVSTTTTTTFIPQRQSPSTINGLSDAPLNNNPMQETIFTTENSIQTVKKSSVSTNTAEDTGKSLSDNVVPSLTEIDELSTKQQQSNKFVTKNPIQKSNIVTKNDNLFSLNGNSENNDNEKDTLTPEIFHQNGKDSQTTTVESSELGQQETDFELNTSQKLLIKNDSDPSNGMTTVPTKTITTIHSNVHGKIAKVFDEDKLLGNKKLKHDSGMGAHNHKKYNHKTNKDKSKRKMNEEGGVNDPNANVENNLSMESIASAGTTLRIPTTSFSNEDLESSTLSWKLSSNGNGETTPHHIDNNFSTAKKIGMEPTINDADTITSSTETPTTDNAHISSSERMDNTPSANTENPLTESVHSENKPQPTAQDFEMETQEHRIETTKHHGKLLTEDNAHNTDAGDNINKAENGFSPTSTPTPTPTPIPTTEHSADIRTTIEATTERHNILDYDKSSEEIFDMARESSSQQPEITSKTATETPTPTIISTQKRPYEPDSDEFFLPADDLDVNVERISSTSSTTMVQHTQQSANTESTIVRPKDEGLTTTTLIAQSSVETTIETDAKQQTTELNKGSSTSGHDSDTIFYISNTEVKVVESSVPTPNSKQENQFFPALYEEDVIIDFPGKNNSGWNTAIGINGDKYEEDIILSPMKSNFDPTKLNDENLSISYVGESFIDIKEATNDDVSATGAASNNDISSEMSSKENIRSLGDNGISSNVIIEPAVIPDMQQQSFGVPIIGELPPQINIGDLDYKSDAVQLNNSGNSISSQTVQHSGDNLQKAQELTAELPKTDSEEALIVTNEKIEIEKRNDTQTTNTTAEPIANVTAYGMFDEEPEPNWNDTQTLIIAGISTVIPLLGCVALVLAIRQIFMKVRQLHKDENGAMNGKGLMGDRSTDPLAINVHTVSSDEIKSSNGEANGINHSNDNLITSTEISTIHCDELTGGAGSQTNHHSMANGSLITMTMKNNHLIVETEERSDIARDVRETKVHYSPSEKDGVFVVEVARGADSNSTPILRSSIPVDHALQGQSTIVEVPEEQVKTIDYPFSHGNDNNACLKSNEEVLVHQPPNGMCNDDNDDVLMIDEDGAVSMSSPKLNGNNDLNIEAPPSNINTGLSQSDLSISSSGDSNRAYCYGTQEIYTVETKGYQLSSSHRSTPRIDRAPTPEPITVISDTEHVNELNANDIPSIAAPDQFNIDPLPLDGLNENIILTFDNDTIVTKSLKINGEFENGNAAQEQIEHVQQNGIKIESIVTGEMNGKINGNHQNGFNGNDHLNEDESNEYDSLMNLPAPPLCEDIKQFTDVTQMENGNVDTLPPPPPELVTAES